MSTLPQLRMTRRLEALPLVTLPEGYTTTALRSGHEADWIQVLNTSDLGDWDLDRARAAMAHGIRPENVLLLQAGSEPVATACVCLHEREGEPLAEIGWVAVVPEHRGRGLGRQVTLAACRRARDLGFEEVFLLTDDHRLPALKTYLSLGFVPDCWHSSHPERWAAIRMMNDE